MGKNKLKKFAENETFDLLFQVDYEALKQEEFHLKGNWGTEFFKNDHPIILEIGCGKGEYTLGLAQRYPDKNFIGIDRKGARLWAGCKQAVENGMTNVGFIRTKAENLPLVFSENEVSEIWITFPDPQPRKSKSGKRLTSPEFLERYRQFLKKDGVVHLKTDSRLLYGFTLEVIAGQGLQIVYQTDDLYRSGCQLDVMGIQTCYESLWLSQGLNIHYLQFKL